MTENAVAAFVAQENALHDDRCAYPDTDCTCPETGDDDA